MLTIFRHELAYWLRHPLPYLFGGCLFALAFVTMWGTAAEADSGPQAEMMNAPYRLNYMSEYVSMLMLFVLPGIIGGAIYRDFKSQMYTVLYSYPITKSAYLMAKFGSAFSVVTLIILGIAVGFGLATFMPGIDSAVLLPFRWNTYLQLVLVFLLPNIFLQSTIVFAVVIYTRNNYIGFLSIILLIFFQNILISLLGSKDLMEWAALLDPTAETTVRYLAQYLSLAERNSLDIPLSGILLYNRLLWIAVGLLVGVIAYRKFDFQQFTQQKSGKNSNTPAQFLARQQQLSIEKLALPQLEYGHTPGQQLLMSWRLSSSDFRYIVFSWPFFTILVAGFLLVYLQQVYMNPMYGFEVLPTTERMLRMPMFIFSFVLNLLTFLYMGVLLYRGQLSRMDALIDTVPQPNWVLLLSRLWAVFKMQFLLLTLIAIGGIITQAINGYYHFELWHYAFELYILQFVHFVIWACLAMLVHTLFKNMYLSFFLLLLMPLAFTGMSEVGKVMNWTFLTEDILQFNAAPGFMVGFDYSAFDQYGSMLAIYFVFKTYWLTLAIIFLLLALLWWKRGLTFSWQERWTIVKSRFQGPLMYWTLISTTLFLGLGSTLYYQTHHVAKISFSQQKEDALSAHNEKQYSHLIHTIQPKLVSADIQMDLYPETRDYQANGQLLFVNKVAQSIDTILVARSLKEATTYEISRAHQVLSQDSLMRFDVLLLDESLTTGDTLRLDFSIHNYPNSLLHRNSRVRHNGTYMMANILPQLGVRNAFLTNPGKRAKYGLGERIISDLLPTDTTLLGYAFADNTMDWIHYNTVISTAIDQQAFSMGTLKNSWAEDGRRYFHYQSEGTISNTISWMSGVYTKQLEEAAGTTIELYHEATHLTYEHLIEGLKASLEYYGDHFGRLQFDTIRVVEYPQTVGTYATVHGNLIPYSEALFLCDIDHEKNDVFNFPFFVSAHEMAHAWWGHRVDPANVLGGKLVTEALADYLAIKISEKAFGKERARQILDNFHQLYLGQRASEGKESPLITAGLNQDYLNYRKGSLAFYALSEYLGETELNAILAHYERSKQNTPPPYPTSLDLLDTIANVVPDSLQYVLHDLFETITLYDNSINEVEITPLATGQYQVNIDFNVSKFRADENGALSYSDVRIQEASDIESLTWKGIQSLPLHDYVRIAFFKKGTNGELARQFQQETVKVTQINNQLQLILSERPDLIILDPDYMLIDNERQNNVWEE